MTIDAEARRLARAAAFENYDTAVISDSQSDLNRALKRAGLKVFDTGRGKPLWAQGPLPEDPWIDGVNAVIDTPFRTYPGWDMALDFKNGGYRSGAVATRDITQLPGYSYGRSGTKFEQEGGGALWPFGPNIPAIVPGIGYWARPQYTNIVLNSQGAGAIVGTPGTTPSNWNKSDPPGVVTTVVAVGVDPVTQASWVDVRVAGTNNGASTAFPGIYFVNAAHADATIAQGDTLAVSAYVAIVAGSDAGFTNGPRFGVDIQASNGAYISQAIKKVPVLAAGAGPRPERQIVIRPISEANATRYGVYVNGSLAAGASVDVTLRITMPQVCKALIAGPYIPTSNAAASTGSDDLVFPSTLQGEDFVALLRFNTEIIPPSNINERPFGFDDNTANERVIVQRQQNAALNGYVLVGGVQNPNNAAIGSTAPSAIKTAGVATVLFRRRAGKVTSAQRNAAGAVGLSLDLDQPWPAVTRNTIGAARGVPAINAAVEFYGLKRGTFSDAEVSTMLRLAGM